MIVKDFPTMKDFPRRRWKILQDHRVLPAAPVSAGHKGRPVANSR
jgi:hypothetical protein